MKIIALYLITASVFLLIDYFGIKYIVRPVFERHIGHLFADPVRIGAATLFYLGYVAGLLWFVSVPALKQSDPIAAFIGGALLGLLAYGTYEFTNYATLKDWSYEQVFVDTLWGGALTGFAAWTGVTAVRWFA
ncbi:DUF2177 family protein [Falsihalocynthiibacter sp. SS001]|uniref:DUF2177 family protein n=1 Tax=Falsihalocynthiibacter sp. SS001 TaxID=3349698 RepID=UPI0036D37C00